MCINKKSISGQIYAFKYKYKYDVSNNEAVN